MGEEELMDLIELLNAAEHALAALEATRDRRTYKWDAFVAAVESRLRKALIRGNARLTYRLDYFYVET
jgi:hypothetical protein